MNDADTDRTASTPALPSGERVLATVSGRWSVRYHRRTIIVSAVLTAVIAAVFVAALLLGDFRVSAADLVNTLAGRPPSRLAEFFVMERRMPRALVAMTVGAALAVAGSIFQTLTRNPLASPDILGISGGASVGAVVVMVVLQGSLQQTALGAVIGGCAAAALIMVLTARTGLTGTRLVLVGVAIAAMGTAVVDFILSQVFVASATTAQTWLIGSLQGASWDRVPPMAITLGCCAVVLAALGRSGRITELGDAAASSLGVRVVRLRWILLVTATLSVAMSVAVAGPISFVALVAPHIARSLCRRTSHVVSALTGAILLTTADLLALYGFAVPIPVGAVTVTIGGAFFLWILIREGTIRDRR